MLFLDYIKSKTTFLVSWFVFHGFALFVNIFEIDPKYWYHPPYIDDETHFLQNGGGEGSDFWPFVKFSESNTSGSLINGVIVPNVVKVHTFNGIFYRYDLSEFIAYSILIFIALYFRYISKKNLSKSKN